MKMKTYTVRFINPAFLGDAEQKGAWRTPPFKALMRQWWRVLAARDLQYDPQKLREEEGRLFGHAWLKGKGDKTWAMKSRVLVRLSRWERGTLTQWPEKGAFVQHPEVRHPPQISTHLYLGFGALTNKGRDPALHEDRKPAVDQSDFAELAVGYPEQLDSMVRDTAQLMHWFGTIGGRSRNGWGSFALEGEGIQGFEALQSSDPLIHKLSRPFQDCLTKDWPHAVGADETAVLVWKSKERYPSWSEVINTLAEAKIHFRTMHKFKRPPGTLEERHILAYPVTKHPVYGWGKSRLANQLRFKVARDDGGFFGIIHHLPCKLPDALCKALAHPPGNLKKILEEQEEIWRQVHECIDQNQSFQRI